MSQYLDSRIIKKIHPHVGDGIRSVDEKERVIKLYIKTELFTEENFSSPENSFPLSRATHNYLYAAIINCQCQRLIWKMCTRKY